MNYFISDLHFGHANIIKYCNRPFKDVHHMNTILTQNWNSVVSPQDTVFVLGDFSMGNPKRYKERLNGSIVLVKGNHDKLSQCKPHFDNIYDRIATTIGGHKVLLCHYYYKEMLSAENYDHKFRDRMPDFDPGQILLHGHCHNSKTHINEKYKAINVSCEWLDYTPILEEKLLKTINTLQES